MAAARATEALSLPWRDRLSSLRDRRGIQQRRDIGQNYHVPTALSIAPSQYWEGNDGPWSTFPLQVGTGAVGGLQDVRVLISTSSTAIWTIGAEGCPAGYIDDCSNSRGGLFMTNQSLTWLPDSIYETGPYHETELGMDTNGYVGYDVATLGWQGSAATPSDHHAMIWNLADSTYWLGMFGLNPRPTNLTTMTNPQPSFMQTLFDQDKIPSLSYGYTAGNQYRLDQVYGSLTLGGYDANRFVPNNVSFDFYEDISRDLSVYLQGISVSANEGPNLLSEGPISVLIDSTVPELWLPESACDAFAATFGLTYDADLDRYLPSSSSHQIKPPTTTFTVGPNASGGPTVSITFPPAAFALHLDFPLNANNHKINSSSQYFPLRRAANSTQYTLGRVFLQESYLFADYEHQNFSVSACEWDPAKINSPEIVSRVSTTKYAAVKRHAVFNAPVVVGSVLGGISILALISLLGFLLARRTRRKRQQAEEEAARRLKEKNVSFYYNPLKQEAGGHPLCEMGTQFTKGATELGGTAGEDPRLFGYVEVAARERARVRSVDVAPMEIQGSVPIYEMDGS